MEVRTDELERTLSAALGDDLDELLEHLDRWSQASIRRRLLPAADLRRLQRRRRTAPRLRADHRHRRQDPQGHDLIVPPGVSAAKPDRSSGRRPDAPGCQQTVTLRDVEGRASGLSPDTAAGAASRGRWAPKCGPHPGRLPGPWRQ
ncbi:hypothetical protein [Streptomyces sp. NBC_01077]|uniref:hypothetical protein n=1 Tax=Streptomyces sp. NBC_01077 TaxID=2903746 RepID=UPI00386CA725